MSLAKNFPDFITITCSKWKPLLKKDEIKDILIESLTFLSNNERINVFAFVIMSNHLHLIWQVLGDHKREDVQRDFLKFTAHQILRSMRQEKSPMLDDILVNAKDRKYQVWKRNSLSIPLWSHGVIWQKLNYIHRNPVKARLCTRSIDYKYSSARFYELNDGRWTFLKAL